MLLQFQAMIAEYERAPNRRADPARQAPSRQSGLRERAFQSPLWLSHGIDCERVAYRIYRGDFKGARRSYRDGEAHEFNWALRAIRERADAEVYDHVKEQLKRINRT